jgi:hypothetical protein
MCDKFFRPEKSRLFFFTFVRARIKNLSVEMQTLNFKRCCRIPEIALEVILEPDPPLLHREGRDVKPDTGSLHQSPGPGIRIREKNPQILLQCGGEKERSQLDGIVAREVLGETLQKLFGK